MEVTKVETKTIPDGISNNLVPDGNTELMEINKINQKLETNKKATPCVTRCEDVVNMCHMPYTGNTCCLSSTQKYTMTSILQE